MREGSVSVLRIDKVCRDTAVGSESQVKLGRTFHPVKIAAISEFTLVNVLTCTRACTTLHTPVCTIKGCISLLDT